MLANLTTGGETTSAKNVSKDTTPKNEDVNIEKKNSTGKKLQ